MSERQKCECCETELMVQWSDTHGVGACTTCGMPYTIYHYEEVDGKKTSVDKPPSIAIVPEWVEIGKRYWQETRGRVFPASFDMGIGRSGRSYSGATLEDCKKFDAWCEAHEAELPRPKAA